MNPRLLMQRLTRFSPLLSLLCNRIAFPHVHCGVLVEFPIAGDFFVGEGVRIGAMTRVYIGSKGRVSLGNRVNVGRDVHLQTVDGHIVIGNGTSIQDHCRLYGDVTVGVGCLFAPNIYVSSGTHVFDSIPHLPIHMQENLMPTTNLPVRIGDDCWIGANVVIMPGVEVAKGCVVGAGSVVTHDVPPYSVIAGVPARLIRKRFDFVPPSEIDVQRNGDWPYFYSGFDISELGQLNRGGLNVGEPFELALYHPSPTCLAIFAQANSEEAEIHFCDQSAAVDLKGSEVLFDVPSDEQKSTRYKFKVSGRVQIRGARLT